MDPTPLTYRLFAVCSPGLERFVGRELGHLGLLPRPSPANPSAEGEPGTEEAGGIEFEGSLPDIYRTNLHVRTASRVLVRLGAFHAVLFPELRRKASHLPWQDYLTPGQPVALRVTCHQSRLYHQKAVAERVAGAIDDRLGKPSPVQKLDGEGLQSPPQLIIVRLVENQCTISVDSSGALLHRRGYRLATAKAPLRETVAAAMLLASGWDTLSPLLDPFCGSGTIAIEAALLAMKIPPGRGRRFAFMDWPNFEEQRWGALLRNSEGPPLLSPPAIFASDRDLGAIRSAQANAERAGVASMIRFSRRAFSAIEPPPSPGWIITNPPFGVRVSPDEELRNLYGQLGKILRLKCVGWRVAILCNAVHLLRHTGLPFGEMISLVNGGLRVILALGRIASR